MEARPYKINNRREIIFHGRTQFVPTGKITNVGLKICGTIAIVPYIIIPNSTSNMRATGTVAPTYDNYQR